LRQRKQSAEIWPFSISQDGGRRHLDFQNVEIIGMERLKTAKVRPVPNFAPIGQAVGEIWPFFNFSRWQPPPPWISKIWKF